MIFNKIKTNPLVIEKYLGKEYELIVDEFGRPLTENENANIKVSELGFDLLIVTDRPHGNIAKKENFRPKKYFYKPKK